MVLVSVRARETQILNSPNAKNSNHGVRAAAAEFQEAPRATSGTINHVTPRVEWEDQSLWIGNYAAGHLQASKRQKKKTHNSV